MIYGLIGKKIGMAQVFKDDGKAEAATVVEAGPCTVVQLKTVAKEGYIAVQLGFGGAKRSGSFRHLREFRLTDAGDIEVGNKVDAGLFKAGDLVDVTGVSKGKGFAGVVKRYGFAGGPKTHGQSDRHRAPGSIGAGSSPGRVLKGKRMPGHMGSSRVTVRRLEVLEADPARNLLVVKGAVPGAKSGPLLIRKSGGGK